MLDKDNNFDNNEDIEILNMADDEHKSEADDKPKADQSAEEYGEDKESEYEDVCFICRRPESKTGRMFKLPNHISVCSDCMHKTKIGRAHV